MDSWTLQGDSYSFLRSAPRNFSLCHRDGTPNHVEIFDIINVPSQSSAISETTCLCDIFGDDCDPPAVSSSPVVEAFVPSQREVDGTEASSPLVDDQNDSSGSYHTAEGSSGEEEEDPTERLQNPLLQSKSSERKLLEGSKVSSELSKDSTSDFESNRKPSTPQLCAANPPSGAVNTVCGERTPSPGHNSSYNLSPDGPVSSVSSTSGSPSLLNPRQAHSEAQPRRITPTFKDRHNSPSHPNLTQSPSPELINCISSSSDSVNAQSFPEFRGAGVSPEPGTRCCIQNKSPSPESVSKDFSPDHISPTSEFRSNLSSPLPSSSCELILPQSKEKQVSPELKNRSYSRSTQASSFLPELRGRVSLPDLFNRGSTPDIVDSPPICELISDPDTAGGNSRATSENRDTGLLATACGTISTPVPRYTPPSPVISSTPSPDHRESCVLPEFRCSAPSSDLLSAASLAKSGTRILSPGPLHKIGDSAPSELFTQVSSPVASYSLSPSPGVRSVSSIHTASSPEIRITASSPEVGGREQSPEVEAVSDSPLLYPQFEFASSRSPTSSPQITGISYSVVQPEDRDSPPFPELCCLSTPESDRTRVYPEARSSTPSRDSEESSRADSAATPRDSPHESGFTGTVQQPEITLSHQSRYQTPSPQPKNLTPSPESRNVTPSSDRYPSPSPEYRGSNPSPVASSPVATSPVASSPFALSPELKYHQHSPSSLSTDNNPYNSQPEPLPHTTPGIKAVSSSPDSLEIHCHTQLEKDDVSPSFKLNKEDKSGVSEILNSPVVVIQSPVSTSQTEGKVDRAPKEESKEELTPEEINLQHIPCLASWSEVKQETSPTFFQIEECCNNPVEKKSLSPKLIFGKERGQNISPDHKAQPNKSEQRLESNQPPHKSYSRTPESSSSYKSKPANSKVQLSSQVGHKNRARFTENMAHHVKERRTPSPPITRFTPVHILAPEKPYRPWQNRGHPQVEASSQSIYLKKEVTNRESPEVVPVDNNSQPHWVRLGKQLEMERKMLLEEEREIGRERERDREMEVGKNREGRELEKGEEWQGNESYRGEQVELSFNARNRKGLGSRSTVPTSRETRPGLPTVHSYSESLLATRQLQQQQSLLKFASQQDAKGGLSRRLQPPASQNKNSARVVTNRPCRSSSSSMGSEFDEADNEVKWFTDLAFSSLSRPEVDYLDMYNSSHRSSTNISQSSTQESPAGVSAAWPAYADFRGSAPKLDNDELSFQQPSAYFSDGLDSSRRYELGSFECIDVAVEREDKKVRRGVPKRQIQLRRKDSAEGKQDANSENSSPGAPAMGNSPFLERHSREALLRQYSTPEAMQEVYPPEHSPEPNQRNERKCKLQKSASLDETCTKTKMATCLIKSVLSKKMQSLEKQPDEQMGDEVIPIYEENILPTESEVRPFKESPKPDTDNLSSSFHSDYGLTSESLARSGEQSPKDEARPSKCFGIKSSSRPSSSSSNRSVNLSHTGNKVANSEGRKATSSRSEKKSELKVPFDSKHTRAGVLQTDDIKTWEESKSGDSANAIAGNTQASFASGASSMQARMTNRHQEFETIENHKKLQQMDKDQSQNKPKTQGISLKGGEKKKASLSVCLTPEAENKPIASSPDMFLSGREERVESDGDVKTDEEDRNADNKVKVIHKVRDVRRLVKNTYNLSFKATGSTMPSDMGEETTEHFNEENKEKIEEERQKDVLGGLEREITKEEKKEEVMVERKVEQKMEMKDEKPPTASPLLQTKGKSPTHPQPMQIQYKAVCCKDDKNKVMPSHKASEKQADESHISPELSLEASREQEDTSDMNVQNTTKDMKANSCKQDSNIQVETHEPKTETYKVLDNVEKPVVVRTDRKPPMLGSLPKLPSKEREVSTAVVLIRDGSSKTKTSASPAQEEIPTPLPTPAASESPELTTSSSGGHSVSMLLKEKGYQADIGAVVGDGKNASGVKGVPYKHVNCLEIPLQTTVPSDSRTELHRERTFSSSSTVSGPSAVSDNTDTPPKREDEEVCIVPTETDKSNEKTVTSQGNMQDQTQPLSKYKMEGDFEAVKRQDPTFPPRSPAIRRFRPQPIEVKSLSKDTQKQETAINNMVNNRPQTIEVKSIAKSSEKPVVPPKPTCKFKPADLGAMQNKPPKLALASSTVQTNNEERSQTIVVSSPTIYRKISNESNSSANYTRKIAVSAVSSLKPSPSKLTATAISSLSNKAVVDPEASNERSQQQHPGASPQSARYTHRPTTVATTPVSAAGQGGTSAPGEVSPKVSQVPELQSPVERQAGQPAVADPNTQLQSPKTTFSQEQVMSPISNNPKQPVAVSTTKAPGYTPHQCHGPLSSEYSQRTNDMRVYASDDPPSYDDRESFSPLTLPDLTPRRSSRYQPSSRLPPCSCTAVCPPNLSLPPSHYHRSPHNLTPPAPPHSPGHALPYPVTQPPLRPHQCRADTQPMNFQPSSSPKSSPLAPNQQSAMYQPVHQPPPCPPHHSLMQACPADRPMQPIDPRRPPAHRSPQQQPPGIAPYSDPGHTHSPGLPPMDPQYLCGPQSLGQSYGSEYGGDTSSLYSESNYGQTPRRVLLDPETGKYFYIEVPMQPLRKMLFDPETGQYVEVLIPQQAMSHSGLYPPTAAPYPSLHNPNMYAPAPQYMPYAAPPPSGHPQTQPQPPRYPEASAAASMHPNGPGVSYRNSSGQGSKPEPPNHPPLDQSYLESMYYVPTGMNASPNTTPPVYYHKHPPNLPPTGGKRS